MRDSEAHGTAWNYYYSLVVASSQSQYQELEPLSLAHVEPQSACLAAPLPRPPTLQSTLPLHCLVRLLLLLLLLLHFLVCRCSNKVTD